MAMEICLTIADDGSMTVSSEDVAAEAQEGMEPTGTPVGSLDEALAAIKELAGAGSLAPTAGDTEIPTAPEEELPPAPSEAAAPAPGQEEAAMMQSFGKR